MGVVVVIIVSVTAASPAFSTGVSGAAAVVIVSVTAASPAFSTGVSGAAIATATKKDRRAT
jgi:hypothetical protein